jgi:hypothetical protein
VTRLVAIDPGVDRCAVARFRDSELGEVFYASPGLLDPNVQAEGWLSAVAGAPTVVAEKPQFDRRCARAVIDLAWSGALVAAAFARGGPVTTYTPSEWKGSQPKPQHHSWAYEALTPAERAVLPLGTADHIARACAAGARDNWRKEGARYYRGAGADVHNLMDAVALGLTHLGRLPFPARADAKARKDARALVRADAKARARKGAAKDATAAGNKRARRVSEET